MNGTFKTGKTVASSPRGARHPLRYVIGSSAGGRPTFSGGGLHEVTAQLHNGSPIYRRCSGPDAVLLLVVKAPVQLSDGAEWLWAKSGKFAAPPR